MARYAALTCARGGLVDARKMGGIMKRIIITLLAAIPLLGLVIPATAASATTAPVVGNYAIADLGQGAWAGGPMYANGTLGGGGAFSMLNGQEILSITSGTWSGSTSGVTICATVRPIKDPLGLAPGPLCIGPLPANTGPVKIDGTLVKISLR